MAHRQVKLFPECRCVGLVGGRRNSVRYRTAVAPPGPYVTNARATALRRSCGNGVTGTGHPGKRLCRTVSGTVNAERATYGACLDSHLDGRCRCWRWCWRRTRDARVKRVNKGLARIVVTRSGGRDDVGGQAIRGETGARVHELIETTFHWQRDAPEFVAVGGAARENVAGMIARLCAPYDELNVQRVDDRSAHIIRERDMPTLRAVRVECEQLT